MVYTWLTHRDRVQCWTFSKIPLFQTFLDSKRTGVRPLRFAKTCILYHPTTKFLKRLNLHLYNADTRWRTPSIMSTTEKLHRNRPPCLQRLLRLQLYLGKIPRLLHLLHRRLLRIRAANWSFIALASLAKYVWLSRSDCGFNLILCSGRLCTCIRSERCSRQSFSM